jgi:hypothetical protein
MPTFTAVLVEGFIKPWRIFFCLCVLKDDFCVCQKKRSIFFLAAYAAFSYFLFEEYARFLLL